MIFKELKKIGLKPIFLLINNVYYVIITVNNLAVSFRSKNLLLFQ